MKVRALIAIVLLAGMAVAGQDRIVFERWTSFGATDLWIMNRDGSALRNITRDPDSYYFLEPAISPDGKRLAFSSNRNPNVWYRIYVMELGGRRTVTELTPASLHDYHSPAWSPDGGTIIFADCNPFADFSPAGTQCDILTVSADGGPITSLAANTAFDENNPSYSPDGSKVLFESDRDGDHEIFVCDASGANVQQLTVNTAKDRWPSWSPDGTKILFSSQRDAATYELYTMDANGGNAVRLTNNSSDDIDADFSSDGTRIAWTRIVGVSPFQTMDLYEAAVGSMSSPRRVMANSPYRHSTAYGFVTRKISRFH